MTIRKNASLQSLADKTVAKAARLRKEWERLSKLHHDTSSIVERTDLSKAKHAAWERWQDIQEIADHLVRLMGGAA